MAMNDGHDENIKALSMREELFPRKGFYPEESEVSWGVALQPIKFKHLQTDHLALGSIFR